MQPKIVFNYKNEAGTTLVELLAAIAILSIIVTAFLAFFVQGARTNNRTNDLTQATFIAQEEMEEIVNYSQTLSIDKLTGEGFSSGASYIREKTESGFFVKTTITKATDNQESRLYKVVVNVSSGGQSQALMENRLPFSSGDD